MTLKETLTIHSRFQRSTQLVRDWSDKRGLDEYLLTPTARKLASQIVRSGLSETNSRAWSITGPYGTGKSAFALFLTDVLANSKPLNTDGQLLRKELDVGNKPFLPVLVVGQRSQLVPALLDRLSESVLPIVPKLAKRIQQAAQNQRITGSELVTLFEEAAAVVGDNGYAGLLVIIDEFGKFLEYTAQHIDTEDLFVIQQLAEATNRGNPPILLVTILHTAFSDYLREVEETQRREWQKVQGRFIDMPFLEPPEQILRLIGAAIERKYPAKVEKKYAQQLSRILQAPALKEATRRLPIDELLPSCIPLHPLTALILWPLFRSEMAQNERSLFSFLSGQEPYGFREFTHLNTSNTEAVSFYRIDSLYDYIVTNMASAVFASNRSRRWAEIDHALHRVNADAPQLAKSVVKTIGLLGMYGLPTGLRASKETLGLAINDPSVDEAIEYLEGAKIIVYRRHEDAYGLWEGSDVDLEACYHEAEMRLPTQDSAEQLKKLVTLRPLVARRHYVLTGTLRYLEVDVISGRNHNLKESMTRDLGSADGQLLFIVTSNEKERSKILDEVKRLQKNSSSRGLLRIVAGPRPIAGLEKALHEFEIWTWINENIQALQGDPVARQEVRARMTQSRKRLLDIAGNVFGASGYPLDPTASDWVQSGEMHNPPSATEFMKWISELCEKVYDKSPVFNNELLNRENISPAAVAARRNLLQAMFNGEGKPNLGIEGNPAEASMFHALLENGGFYRSRGGKLCFGQPNQQWLPVWRSMEGFLSSTRSGRKPVMELFARLKSPPYGLRDGPIPVLFCALLLANRDDVALYQNGTFIPEPSIEVFEMLTRVPELFEVQRYAVNKNQREAFEAINRVIESIGWQVDTKMKLTLLQVVKPLVMFVASLPGYTKRTKRLKFAHSAKVRDALLEARDPYSLVFQQLPVALGLNLQSEEDVTTFAKELKQSLIELQHAYPQLLDEIEAQVRIAFRLPDKSDEARRRIVERARQLDEYVVEGTLALFVREVGRLGDRDWREVFARVINRGVPPSQWNDTDILNFQVQLRQLTNDFAALEEMVAETNRTGAPLIIRIGLLDVRSNETQLISVAVERSQEVNEMAEKIINILEKSLNEDRQLHLAALALASQKYLNEKEN